MVAAVVSFAPGFWSRKFLRQLGLPWFIEVFYGTLLMISIVFLTVTFLTFSTVVAGLAIVGFALYRLVQGGRGRQIVRHVMKQPTNTAASILLRPLVMMMAEGSLMAKLQEVRQVIEREVLYAINHNRNLARYGRDFETVGVHTVKMREVDGDQSVLIEFPAMSSVPQEVIVRVVASRPQSPSGEEQVGLIFDKWEGLQWQYEEVTVTTSDGLVVDLTRALERRGSARPRSIVIDTPRYSVKEDEEEASEGRRRHGRSRRSNREKRYGP